MAKTSAAIHPIVAISLWSPFFLLTIELPISINLSATSFLSFFVISITYFLLFKVEAAADALLPPRVVDHREVRDVELPVEVSAAEDAHDVGEFVLINVALGERDVRRPLVRVVVVRDRAGNFLSDAAPDFFVQLGERGAADDWDVEYGACDGEDTESGGADSEGAHARGERAKEPGARLLVVSLRDLEREVRVRRDVHPAHVELLPQLLPDRLDTRVVPVIQQRNHALHQT